MKAHEEDRDISIDVLRGISIFTMVAANIGALILTEPHPIWFRFYGTFAAPLFILLAGMMVVFTQTKRDYGLKYYMIRGGMVIAVGAFVDVFIMKIYPFMGIEVLYLIGLSLPIAYLLSRLKRAYQLGAIIAIIILTPALQWMFGYASYPLEISLSGIKTEGENQHNILYQWLVDGWFPIFPWLAFSIVGVIIASIRWQDKGHIPFQKHTNLALAILSLSIGTLIWWYFPGGNYIRDSFSELFYPPTIGYMFLAIGVILTLFYLVDVKPDLFLYKPFQILGESALFIYIFHLAAGEYFFGNIWDHSMSIDEFIPLYLLTMSILIAISYGIRIVKDKWPNRPLVVRFLLGG